MGWSGKTRHFHGKYLGQPICLWTCSNAATVVAYSLLSDGHVTCIELNFLLCFGCTPHVCSGTHMDLGLRRGQAMLPGASTYSGEDPLLLVSGGTDKDGNTLKDVWLLNMNAATWKEVGWLQGMCQRL